MLSEDLKVMFELVGKRKPLFKEIIDNNKDVKLIDFVKNFQNEAYFPEKTIQDKNDLVDIASSVVEKILGRDISSSLRSTLYANPNILTANHHSINYIGICSQGTIAFALSRKSKEITPVFAFGDVPLNNITYPRGILFENETKLPIFPDKDKNRLVSFTPAYNKEQIYESLKKLNDSKYTNALSDKQINTSKELLEGEYLKPEVLECNTYSQQLTLLNYLLWDKTFADDVNLRKNNLVQIEIEVIAKELILLDLENEDSLLNQILFNKNLRGNIIDQLDKNPGCWDLDKIKNHRETLGAAKQTGTGSLFFWGVTEHGKRIPMLLEDKDESFFLVGEYDNKKRLIVPLTKDGIKENVKNGKLLPVMFLTFSLISFARGYKCYGGFLQVDYLTEMKRGLSAALRMSALTYWAMLIDKIPTKNYCTGMIFSASSCNRNKIYLTGGLEFIANGGITLKQLDKISNISIEDSHLLGLPSIYKRLYSGEKSDEKLSNINIEEICSYKKDSLLILHT